MNKLISWWQDRRDWRQACREYAHLHEPRKVFERYYELRQARALPPAPTTGDDHAPE